MGATGARSVAVTGDIRNSVIVTGDNVNLQVQLDSVDGALLHRLAAGAVAQPLALPLPLDSRPRRYPDHVDRESEAGAILVGVQEGGVINVYGEPGIGKSHLLSHVAHSPAGGVLPDGIVYVAADTAPLDDVLQALFEEFYDCGDPPVRLSRSRLRRALRDRRALVVVDELALEREDAQAVLSAATGCAFVVASTARSLWDGGAIQLEGLELEFALAIVEQEIRRPLTPDERVEAEALCNALAGHPWRIREAASRARDEGRSLAEVARSLDPSAMLAALTSGEESVLAGLAAVGGGPVGLEHVRELSAVEDVDGVLAGLERRHLVLSHSPRHSLAGPLAEELERRTDLEPLRARALEYFAGWAEREKDPAAVAAERPAVLDLLRWANATGRGEEAIRLGRASEAAFASAGRFGAWGAAVDGVLEAARGQGDLAAEGWGLHQRGTSSFSLEQTKAALADLESALEIRRQLGDRAGEEATRHNIEVVRGTFPWHTRFGKGGGWGLLALVAIGVILIAAAVGGALALRGDDEAITTTTGPDGTVLVVVPGVVGDTIEDAGAQLEEAGLEVEAEQAFSEDEPAGIVLAQDPAEGAEVEVGSLVALMVSAGPQPVQVPNVVRQTEERALGVLEGVGLKGSVEERVASNDVAAGLVIAQSPDSGTEVAPGSEVDLIVSTGPEPDLAVSVDDLNQECNGTCEVTVTFTLAIANDAASSEGFDVLIEVSPDAAMTIEIDGLEAGEPVTREETLEVTNGCFVPDCTAMVTIDPEGRTRDPNRRNNRDERVEPGPVLQ